MTLPSLTPTLPAESVTHLGLEDLDRIDAALNAAHASTTLATYASAWQQWERWCTGRGLEPLPGDPVAVCAYLTERAAAGLAIASLDVTCSATSYHHRTAGLPTPTAHEGVRRVRRGLRRSYGAAPRRPARPLDPAGIGRIVAAIDHSTTKGLRDTALILLGFASALRCAELAGLTLADLEAKPGGILLHIRASKTDPERHGQVVAVAHGQHYATDPIAALDAWRDLRGSTPGPLFTSMRGCHRTGPVRIEPISPTAVADTVHDPAEAAGLDATRITGHSLRAGHATTAALAGVPIDRIAAQTGHRQIAVLIERYIRPAQALHVTSSRDLGL